MAKKKAKRYTAEEKQEILDFITNYGRGGQTAAVKKFKVTAASISIWRKKADGGAATNTRKSGGSKELKTVKELSKLLGEIAKTEDHLFDLRKRYKKARAKL